MLDVTLAVEHDLRELGDLVEVREDVAEVHFDELDDFPVRARHRTQDTIHDSARVTRHCVTQDGLFRSWRQQTSTPAVAASQSLSSHKHTHYTLTSRTVMLTRNPGVHRRRRARPPTHRLPPNPRRESTGWVAKDTEPETIAKTSWQRVRSSESRKTSTRVTEDTAEVAPTDLREPLVGERCRR